MRAIDIKPRSSQAGAATAAVERFWVVAGQLARAAEVAAGVPPAALVQARHRLHANAGNASDLAAELAALGEKIEEIRGRLAATDKTLVSREEREGATAEMKRMVRDEVLVAPSAFLARRQVTRQALSKALGSHRIFQVEVEGQRYIPSFFLDPRLERRQLEEVCKALGELPGMSKLQFFTTRKASLAGKTPLAALADGQYSQVRVAARGFAER